MDFDEYIYVLRDMANTYECSLTMTGEKLDKNDIIECSIREYVLNKLIDEIDANRGKDPDLIIKEYRDRYYEAYENATGKTMPLIFLEMSQAAASIGL